MEQKQKKIIRSSIPYTGNKYKIMGALLKEFPSNKDVELFIDLFGGGGTVTINTDYEYNIYNEVNELITGLLEYLRDTDFDYINDYVKTKQKQFKLVKGDKEAYLRFRDYFNEDPHYEDLFVLYHYAFSTLIRFNKEGKYNVAVGNQHYTQQIQAKRLKEFKQRLDDKKIHILEKDFRKAVEEVKDLTSEVFKPRETLVYMDPPYIDTVAVYTEGNSEGKWTKQDEQDLYKKAEELHNAGIKIAISNKSTNTMLTTWAKEQGFNIIELATKTHNQMVKGSTHITEILVTNYDRTVEADNGK